MEVTITTTIPTLMPIITKSFIFNGKFVTLLFPVDFAVAASFFVSASVALGTFSLSLFSVSPVDAVVAASFVSSVSVTLGICSLALFSVSSINVVVVVSLRVQPFP